MAIVKPIISSSNLNSNKNGNKDSNNKRVNGYQNNSDRKEAQEAEQPERSATVGRQ